MSEMPAMEAGCDQDDRGERFASFCTDQFIHVINRMVAEAALMATDALTTDDPAELRKIVQTIARRVNQLRNKAVDAMTAEHDRLYPEDAIAR